ncbi:MAG: Gfo/Idh/MocA family oxidoreductase [Anaerolineae bacterium]|nr:Gfo/Idh/MocA family oxidoreductase [Anaerolineae bacterium]MBL8107145.1 Gfo/Idh/MocA family oxidoreductase [Anaerolineales bacterium]MCC7188666.1 Gfo/Idh/MocA family oxidoreductase [Anaerolineales bacterium]
MKFLIAGLGSIGRRHMRNLIALGEKDIVLYRTRKATMPEEELAGFPQETDLQAALEKHKPDAVIVSNPTSLHLDVAIPAAEAGCSLLLEKPLSHSMDRIDELESALKKGGGRVVVGFQFRFHPGMMKAKQLISDGEIGRVISAHVHFGEYLPAWHPWEDYRQGYAARADMGGGVVLTQCHSLDYLPWLVGKVESVWGFTAKLSDLEVDVEDTAKIGLRFENSALGSIHLDYNQQPPAHYFEVVGTKGSLQWNLADGATQIYRAERSHIDNVGEVEGGEKAWEVYQPAPEFERNVMFMDEMKHFIAVARGEVESSCPLEDGINVQRLIGAVLASSNSGTRIKISTQ